MLSLIASLCLLRAHPASGTCADSVEDCAQWGCCKRRGFTCFQKNEWYSGCLEDCTPDDTPDGEPWTCTPLVWGEPQDGGEVDSLSGGADAASDAANASAEGPESTSVSSTTKRSARPKSATTSSASRERSAKPTSTSRSAKGSAGTTATTATPAAAALVAAGSTADDPAASGDPAAEPASAATERRKEPASSESRASTSTASDSSVLAAAADSPTPADQEESSSPSSTAQSEASRSPSSSITALTTVVPLSTGAEEASTVLDSSTPAVSTTDLDGPADNHSFTEADAPSSANVSEAHAGSLHANSSSFLVVGTSSSMDPILVTSTTTGTTSERDQCGSCTPSKRSTPDVVIPFWEHDLCKMGYTVQSIAKHDPEGLLGTVVLMWISTQPSSNFQEAIDKMMGSLKGSHVAKLVDFSQQVAEEHVSGWLAQQVYKLKAATLVESDFYVVLDAKNTLVRDVEPHTFFTPCNQGKIFGMFRPDHIPEPHASWYRRSAAALGVEPPESSATERWPTSITPVVIHRRTVMDLLEYIGEVPSADKLCEGPLCEMLGAHSVDGQGATEFTLFILFARTQPEIACDMAVEEVNESQPLALSLWRGTEEMQAEVNLEACRQTASGEATPLMFGSQTAALELMSSESRQEAEKLMVEIYTSAGLHDSKVTSADALVRCVAGDAEGLAGPVEDGGDAPRAGGGGSQQAAEEPTSRGRPMGVLGHDVEQAPAAVAGAPGAAEELTSRGRPMGVLGHGVEQAPAAAAGAPGASPPQEEGDAGADISGFCCTDAQSDDDMCGTCWEGAKLQSDSYCGSSEEHCASCQGSWCAAPREDVSDADADEKPGFGVDVDKQLGRVKESCAEFSCTEWDRSSLCECTATCNQPCDDELLHIRMAQKFSERSPQRPTALWYRAYLRSAVLAAPLAVLAGAAVLSFGRWCSTRPWERRDRVVSSERQALVEEGDLLQTA